jgi:hypothetical protein
MSTGKPKPETYCKPYTLRGDDFSTRQFFACYPELRGQKNWWLWLGDEIPGFRRMNDEQRREAAFALISGQSVAPMVDLALVQKRAA